MDFLKSIATWFFDNVYNVPVLIRTVGPYGLMAVVFAETGLLVGFFLPGDSLLIRAGDWGDGGGATTVNVNGKNGAPNAPITIAAYPGDRKFTRRQVRNLGRTHRVYNWGDYDGTGEPIRLTWRKYFEGLK